MRCSTRERIEENGRKRTRCLGQVYIILKHFCCPSKVWTSNRLYMSAIRKRAKRYRQIRIKMDKSLWPLCATAIPALKDSDLPSRLEENQRSASCQEASSRRLGHRRLPKGTNYGKKAAKQTSSIRSLKQLLSSTVPDGCHIFIINM